MLRASHFACYHVGRNQDFGNGQVYTEPVKL